MYREEYLTWLNSDFLSENEKNELKLISNNESEIENRFYTGLSFGTAGMRGIRGVGKNRMNRHNIRKATQGLANYILKETGENGAKRGVAIAYDCRLDSEENAINTALVLAGNGIKAYLFKELRTTPELSFAVRYLKAQAGVMITASHNPKEYNGYKVYWEDGAQIVDPQAKGIVSSVENVEYGTAKVISKEEALAKGLLIYIDETIDTAYIEEVKKNRINLDILGKEDLKIVYSPLHGTAGRPVKRVLNETGFKNIFVVKEQDEPNGNFPTCSYANPEDTSVFKLSTNLADEVKANLCIANDPDGDRVGIAIRDDDGKWFYPNGNQIGILFAEYILATKKNISANACMISTIVSTPLLTTIGEKNGIKVFRTLTGFKYIGEKIRQFENKEIDATFLLGFEEAIGYLVGTHVRDKDAVVASMLIAEMAAYYESKNSNLYRELIKIYEKYGWRLEHTVPITKAGKDGLEEIATIMKKLRETKHTEINGIKILKSTDFENDNTGLPKSDIMQFILEDETYLTVRPSGTEPKIKYYISVVDKNKDIAQVKLERMINEFKKYVESL